MSPLLTRLIALTERGYRVEFFNENTAGAAFGIILRKVDEHGVLSTPRYVMYSRDIFELSAVDSDSLVLDHLSRLEQKIEANTSAHSSASRTS